MNIIFKKAFLLLVSVLMFASCSSDDKNPPTAGFSLTPETPIQEAITIIISTATAAKETTYSVAGGEYKLNISQSSIQFLEAKTYTIIQTVTNEDGTDQYTIIVDVKPFNPPTAGFTLDPESPKQDQVTNIVDSAVGSSETSYAVTGGKYVIENDNSSITFLEAKTYTMIQTVVNQDGKDEYSLTVDVKPLNPPYSGFTLDPTDLVQWDTALVTDASSGSDVAPTYAVSGGEFIYLGNTIQFLEAKTYTITQTVENEDGVDSSSQSVDVGTPMNKYTLDGTDVPITTNAFWFSSPDEDNPQRYIRMLIPISGQDNPDLIKLYPIAGPDPLEGTYTWADPELIEPRTYDAGMTKDYAGFNYEWTTNGDEGEDMEIKLIYSDPNNDDDNVYDIMLTSYTLDYGQYTFTPFAWISEGTKELELYYRGKINAIN